MKSRSDCKRELGPDTRMTRAAWLARLPPRRCDSAPGGVRRDRVRNILLLEENLCGSKEPGEQTEELTSFRAAFQTQPDLKIVFRRGGVRVIRRPGVFGVGSVTREGGRQVFDLFGQRYTFPDQMSPV